MACSSITVALPFLVVWAASVAVGQQQHPEAHERNGMMSHTGQMSVVALSPFVVSVRGRHQRNQMLSHFNRACTRVHATLPNDRFVVYLNESEARRLNESACHVRKMPKAMKVSPPLLARQSKAYCGPHARLVVIMADCETHCLSLHHSMCQTGILRPGVVSGVTSTCVGKDNTRCVIRLRGQAWDSDLIALASWIADQPTTLFVEGTFLSVPYNDHARAATQNGALGARPYNDPDLLSVKLNLTGDGEVVGVLDTGIDTAHCAFATGPDGPPLFNQSQGVGADLTRSKIVQYVVSPLPGPMQTDSTDEKPDGHGSHVCGTIVGTDRGGLSSNVGMAPHARIAFFDGMLSSAMGMAIPDDMAVVFDWAAGAGAAVHSNSWGSAVPIPYNTQSEGVDTYMYENPTFLAVYAAGNAGACGRRATIGQPAGAKNALTVGASLSNGQLNVLAWFSSQGPASDDGRIKPDVIAPGNGTVSVDSGTTCGTTTMSGTSMATPVVSGHLLLVRQWFRREMNLVPSGSLLKAMMVASGVELTSRSGCPTYKSRYPAPDNDQGWGRVQLDRVLYEAPGHLLVVDKAVIPDNTNHVYRVCVKAGAISQVRIALTWTDPPGSPIAPTLINDLDLVVLDTATGAFGLGNHGDLPDRVNPVEVLRYFPRQTSRDTELIIEVRAQAIRQGDGQAYSLVVSSDLSLEGGAAAACHSGPRARRTRSTPSWVFTKTSTPSSAEIEQSTPTTTIMDFDNQ